MPGGIRKFHRPFSLAPERYAPLLSELIRLIDHARADDPRQRQRGTRTRLYWNLGRAITRAHPHNLPSPHLFTKLADDLRDRGRTFARVSSRTLGDATQFFATCPDPRSETHALACLLSWPQIQTIFNNPLLHDDARLWYLRHAVTYRYPPRAINSLITAAAHLSAELVPGQAALAGQTFSEYEPETAAAIFKENYCFNFIPPESAKSEQALENALVTNITQTLDALGEDFAFVGRQQHAPLAGRRFRTDLLFYNFLHKRYIVIELKCGRFNPEFVSKTNLYYAAIDAQRRTPDHGPTLGLILCQQCNRIIFDYAENSLRRGIALATWHI